MNTGQTMLTIAALAMLSIITMRYYSSVATSGRIIEQSNAGLTATTIVTSYIERSQKLHFDEVTVGSDTVLTATSINALSTTLGREFGEDSIDDFNDFDDFNNFNDTINSLWMNERYATHFEVHYVTNNINVISNNRTLLKRLDIVTWRCEPPIDTSTGASFYTARASTVMGYFKFSN